MSGAYTPVDVLCCYAHADEPWLRRLETHLGALQRQGIISLWHDRLLVPGTDWARALDAHLETASVILLLVSPDFLASDYCYSIEMKRALERQAAGEARVVPILVRPADWQGSPFAHLSVLPPDARPISPRSNKDAVLTEVATSIRRVIVEELPLVSARASRAGLPSIWNIPYPRNPFFLGRAAELVQIYQNLHNGQATALFQPQAISGLGGIGKTQLALEYAYRYRQDYQAVLWAHAENAEALVSSCTALATLLNLPEREAREQDIMLQAVKGWLQTHRDWLLILDNADDLSLLSAFLPPNLGGHVLLTTRAAATRRLAQRLEIETLPPEQGALFLLRRAGLLEASAGLAQASSQDQERALHISQELGGLPLALDQAGAYLEETGMDLASYWQIYQQHRAHLLQQRGGLVADHPEPVATTWSLSFHEIEKKNPAAADLLRMCAHLSPDAIPEELFPMGASLLGPVLAPVAADAFLLNQAIEALRAYSLVRRDPKQRVLSIHRLVQAVVQDEQEEEAKQSWRERVVLVVNAVFPEKARYIDWPQCERLLPHALLAAHFIQNNRISGSEAEHLLYLTARYLRERARYQEAEALYQQTLRTREQVLGFDHPDVAVILTSLATLYRERGKYEQAEPLFQRALRIREQSLGPEHPDVASPLASLAILYRERGKYEQAEPLFQRALRIREQAWGSEHSNIAVSLTSLATLYREQGKYEQAEALHQRALRIREQAWGSEHPNVALSLTPLATLYCEQGKYKQAEPLFQRALRIREQAWGSEHQSLVLPLAGLATLYREQGKYEQAELLFQRALRIREQNLTLEHLHAATLLYNFALLCEAQGKKDEARSFYTRALAIRDRLGWHHPKTKEVREHLVTLLHTMEQHEEAARLERAPSES